MREAGARFANLFGSRADGMAREDSDIDLAAWFGCKGVDPLSVRGVDFSKVDLVVLDSCPLDLAGRIARGKLQFDDDVQARRMGGHNAKDLRRRDAPDGASVARLQARSWSILNGSAACSGV